MLEHLPWRVCIRSRIYILGRLVVHVHRARAVHPPPFLRPEGAFSRAVFPRRLGLDGTGCSTLAWLVTRAGTFSVTSTSHTSAPFYLAAAVLLGWSVCVWFGALMTTPFSSCLQTRLFCTHGSSRISSMSALRFGSRSSIRPMMCRVSRGNNLNKRRGPLIVGC